METERIKEEAASKRSFRIEIYINERERGFLSYCQDVLNMSSRSAMMITHTIRGLRDTLKELEVDVPNDIQKYLEQRESKIQTDFVAYESNLVRLMKEAVESAIMQCDEIIISFTDDDDAKEDIKIAEVYLNAVGDVVTNGMKEVEVSRIPDSIKQVFMRKLILKKEQCENALGFKEKEV